jgi:hypothetical protein
VGGGEGGGVFKTDPKQSLMAAVKIPLKALLEACVSSYPLQSTCVGVDWNGT